MAAPDFGRLEQLFSDPARRAELEEEVRRQEVERSLNETAASNPDQVARDRELAHQYDVEPGQVETHREDYEAASERDAMQLDELAKAAPVTHEKLADPTFAEVARDDVGALGTIEAMGRDAYQSLQRGGVGVQRMMLGAGEAFGEALGLGASDDYSYRLYQYDKRLAELDVDYGAPERGLAGHISNVMSFTAEMAPLVAGTAVAGGVAYGAGALAAAAGVPIVTAGALSSVASSLFLYSQLTGEVYTGLESIELGEDQELNRQAGAWVSLAAAAPMAALERLGFSKIPGVKRLVGAADESVTTAFLREASKNKKFHAFVVERMAQRALTSAVVEGSTEFGQQGLNVAALELFARIEGGTVPELRYTPKDAQDRPILDPETGQPLELFAWSAALAQLLDAGIAGAYGGGGMAIGGSALQVATESQAADRLRARTGMMNQVAASRLRERDKPTFQQHMRDLVEREQAPGYVYVDRAALNELAQSSEEGEDGPNEEMQSILDNVPAFDGGDQASEETGADVAIPYDQYMTWVAGTQAGEALQLDVRYDLDEMTPRQEMNAAAEAAAQAEQFTQEELDELDGDQPVLDAIEKRLVAAIGQEPRFGDQEASAFARLLTAHIKTRAERTGRTVRQIIEEEGLVRIVPSRSLESGPEGPIELRASLESLVAREEQRARLRRYRREGGVQPQVRDRRMLRALAELGGVVPGSDLGQLLSELDVPERGRGSIRGLYSEGGLTNLDQLVPDELASRGEGRMSDVLSDPALRNEAGELDPDLVSEAIRRELGGDPYLTGDEQVALGEEQQEFERVQAALEEAGLDLDADEEAILDLLAPLDTQMTLERGPGGELRQERALEPNLRRNLLTVLQNSGLPQKSNAARYMDTLNKAVSKGRLRREELERSGLLELFAVLENQAPDELIPLEVVVQELELNELRYEVVVRTSEEEHTERVAELARLTQEKRELPVDAHEEHSRLHSRIRYLSQRIGETATKTLEDLENELQEAEDELINSLQIALDNAVFAATDGDQYVVDLADDYGVDLADVLSELESADAYNLVTWARMGAEGSEIRTFGVTAEAEAAFNAFFYQVDTDTVRHEAQVYADADDAVQDYTGQDANDDTQHAADLDYNPVLVNERAFIELVLRAPMLHEWQQTSPDEPWRYTPHFPDGNPIVHAIGQIYPGGLDLLELQSDIHQIAREMIDPETGARLRKEEVAERRKFGTPMAMRGYLEPSMRREAQAKRRLAKKAHEDAKAQALSNMMKAVASALGVSIEGLRDAGQVGSTMDPGRIRELEIDTIGNALEEWMHRMVPMSAEGHSEGHFENFLRLPSDYGSLHIRTYEGQSAGGEARVRLRLSYIPKGSGKRIDLVDRVAATTDTGKPDSVAQVAGSVTGAFIVQRMLEKRALVTPQEKQEIRLRLDELQVAKAEARLAESAPPDTAPYRSTQAWTDLGLKTLLLDAVDRGLPAITMSDVLAPGRRWGNHLDYYYTTVLPARAKKLANKYGGKFIRSTDAFPGTTMSRDSFGWKIVITPEMRAAFSSGQVELYQSDAVVQQEFTSKMREVLEQKLADKGTPASYTQSVSDMAKSGKFKQDELVISRLLYFLNEWPEKKITKSDVMNFLDQGGMTVTELHYGEQVQGTVAYDDATFPIFDDTQTEVTYYGMPDYDELQDEARQDLIDKGYDESSDTFEQTLDQEIVLLQESYQQDSAVTTYYNHELDMTLWWHHTGMTHGFKDFELFRGQWDDTSIQGEPNDLNLVMSFRRSDLNATGPNSTPDGYVRTWLVNDGKVASEAYGGEVKYKTYTMDGPRTNDREVVLEIPDMRATMRQVLPRGSVELAELDELVTPQADDDERAERKRRLSASQAEKVLLGDDFEEGHWDNRRVVAHYRTDERHTPDGSTVTFANEFQSELHRKARERAKNTNERLKEMNKPETATGYQEPLHLAVLELRRMQRDLARGHLRSAQERLKEFPEMAQAAVAFLTSELPDDLRAESWVPAALELFVALALDTASPSQLAGRPSDFIAEVSSSKPVDRLRDLAKAYEMGATFETDLFFEQALTVGERAEFIAKTLADEAVDKGLNSAAEVMAADPDYMRQLVRPAFHREFLEAVGPLGPFRYNYGETFVLINKSLTDEGAERVQQIAEQISEAKAAFREAEVAHNALANDPALHLQGGVPRTPLKQGWMLLVFKHFLRDAVMNGSDYAAFATGEVAAEQYDLRQVVDSLDVTAASEHRRQQSGATIELEFNLQEGGKQTSWVDDSGNVVYGEYKGLSLIHI